MKTREREVEAGNSDGVEAGSLVEMEIPVDSR